MAILIAVDSRVSVSDEVLSGLSADAHILRIDPDSDGIRAIADWLSAGAAAGTSYSSLEIISHGSPGSVLLGKAELSSDTLPAYLDELKTIGESLADGGDIRFYGCDVGQGEAARLFLQTLSDITGADIVASDNSTGASLMGGDANLEINIGDISTQALFTQAVFDDLGVLLDAGTKAGSSNTDSTYTTANSWVYTPITISGAPTNATITSVSVTWNVDSNYASDVDWYVENFNYWNSSTFTDMVKTGDDWLDGYNETSGGSSTVYPSSTTPVNGTWYFNIKDGYNDSNADWNKGRIDSWSISINYTYILPDTPPTSVSSLAISGGTQWNSDNTPNISWSDASDDKGVNGYYWHVDSGGWTYLANSLFSESVTLSTLSEGSHTFQVYAVDTGGQSGPTNSLTFSIDNQAPTTPALLGPTHGATTNDQTPTFSWSASSDAGSGIAYYEIEVYDWELDWGDIKTTTTATSYTPTSDIPYDTVYWTVKAVDNSGKSTTSAERTLNIEQPQITAIRWENLSGTDLSGTTASVGDTVYVEVDTSGMRGTNATVYLYDYDFGLPDDYLNKSFSILIPTSSNTARIPWVVEWNTDNNVLDSYPFPEYRIKSADTSVQSGVLNVRETTAPGAPGTPDLSASIDSGYSNTDNVTNATAPTFSWAAATDSQSGVVDYAWKVDAGAWTWIGNSTSVTTGAIGTQGAHTFYVQARDAAGNIGTSSQLAFTVDTVAPGLPSGLAPTGQTSNATPTFNWSAADTGGSGIWKYEIDVDRDLNLGGNDNFTSEITTSSWAGNAVHGALSYASYLWQVRAYDIAGNVTSWTADQSLQIVQPQITAIRWEDAAGNELADGVTRNVDDTVYVEVDTSGMRGTNATVYLYEDDGGFTFGELINPALSVPIPTTSDTGRAVWTVQWNADSDGADVFPEYRLWASTSIIETLSSRLLNVADPDDQITEAVNLGTISAVSTTESTIGSGTDVNVFKFTVDSANQRLAFDIDRPSGTLDSVLRIFDTSGAPLPGKSSSNNGDSLREETVPLSSQDAYIEYTFDTPGIYYFGVSASGNSGYDPVSGAGDVGGATSGPYTLVVTPVTQVTHTVSSTSNRITGQLMLPNPAEHISANEGKGYIDVSIERYGGGPIEAGRTTWILIHGRTDTESSWRDLDGTGPLEIKMAEVLDNFSSNDQVLLLDWSEGAKDNHLLGVLDSIALDGAVWIPLVADWASGVLKNLGITGSNLDLVGHSWGSYIAYEMSARIGGVQSIVALDPAQAGWEYDYGAINFAAYSNSAWAFYGLGEFGSIPLSATADEAFTVSWANEDGVYGPWDAHAAPRLIFYDIVAANNVANADGVIATPASLFALDRLLAQPSVLGPWTLNQYSSVSLTDFFSVQPVFEGRFSLRDPNHDGFWEAVDSFRYVNHSGAEVILDDDNQLSEAVLLGPVSSSPITVTNYAIDIGTGSPGTDVDLFAFAVISPNQVVGFDIDSTSVLDSYIRLFDGNGTELANNNAAAAPGELLATDSYLEYPFYTPGTYYLGVSANPNSAYSPLTGGGASVGQGGSYNLNVSIIGTVTPPPNVAPVLTDTVVTLAIVNEDVGTPSGVVGTLVSGLVNLNPPAGGLDNVTDADVGALIGVAITGTNTSNGALFYSTDNGGHWTSLGGVSNTSARLLAADANTRVYFQPNADFNGTVSDAITFRAWDRTSGSNGGTGNASANGGNTPFSTTSDTATITVNGVNDAPTGSVTIAGTNTNGQTLTAANTLGDVDGVGTINYQWKATGTAISGATASTYALTAAEVDKAITVVASYTDGHGTLESVTSGATAPVANVSNPPPVPPPPPVVPPIIPPVVNVNAAPTGELTITGTATQAQTLTAANALADTDGLGSIGYQWRADGEDIIGATASTLTLTEAQVGKVISVVANYTDGRGKDESVTSGVTAVVANVNDASTGAVAIAGTAMQGRMLTAANILADADGLGTISYQWKASGSNISGATGNTFVLTEAHVGKVITVAANYTDRHGTAESVTSGATAAVANVNDVPTGAVTITGTATQGQTLTATNTLADADGLGTIYYQWKVSGSNISGATASIFDLTGAEVGKAITVAASYSDGHGTAESVMSSATGAVFTTATPPIPTPPVEIDGVRLTGTTETTATGARLTTVTVPVVSGTWKGDANSGNATQADIPLAVDSTGSTLLEVSIPIGIGLISETLSGGTSPGLLGLLTAAVQAKNGTSEAVFANLQQRIDAYTPTVHENQQVAVRTITFSAMATAPDHPILITGAVSTEAIGGNAIGGQEAIVIDARSLPSGTVLQLDNVEFALVVGAVHLSGGAGRNYVVGDDAAQHIVLGPEDDVIYGGGGDDYVGSLGGDDQLFGDDGNDTVSGGAGNDILTGGAGSDTLNGGEGIDTARFGGRSSDYFLVTYGQALAVIPHTESARLLNGMDTLTNIELLSFAGDGSTRSASAGDRKVFGLEYIASYPDLIAAFRTNAEAGVTHYFQAGMNEGRVATFDALKYTASYGDLIGTFGTNTTVAAAHYINNGHTEGRTATFDALKYTASYGDLINAFGTNTTAAETHYINNGYAEGRTATFDALKYTASYSDLIMAFGTNATAAEAHYITNGYAEGRTATFDALKYTASYGDLINAFGTNTTAAEAHYITNGYAEGRTATFDGQSYVATNLDLLAAFGLDALAGARHYITNGIHEGRQTSLSSLQIRGADDDILIGTTGKDLLDGGKGQDTLTGRTGQDIFVLRAGDGGATLQLADLIADFQDGTDLFGLAESLQYVDMRIQQGTGEHAADTIISTGSGEYLAILNNLLATSINSQDFVHL